MQEDDTSLRLTKACLDWLRKLAEEDGSAEQFPWLDGDPEEITLFDFLSTLLVLSGGTGRSAGLDKAEKDIINSAVAADHEVPDQIVHYPRSYDVDGPSSSDRSPAYEMANGIGTALADLAGRGLPVEELVPFMGFWQEVIRERAARHLSSS